MATVDPVLNALKPIYPKDMTYEERIRSIFDHEKQYRGIDWIALYDQGPSGRAKAAQLAHKHLLDFAAEHGLSDEHIPAEVHAMLKPLKAAAEGKGWLGDGTDVMPIWPTDDAFVRQWENAQGDDIKNMIATQISAMQSMQTVHNDPALLTQITLGLGVTAWLAAAYRVFTAIRAAATATEAYAIIEGILAVGSATVVFVVTTVVLAVLIPILLIMMKDATCYMVIVNNSSDDLNVDGGVYLTHGNLNLQFVDYNQARRIPGKQVITDPNGRIVATSYFCGFLVAQKKSAALYGSQGAFKFASTPTFPQGISVGWEIPLTIFGGWNRELVSASFNGSPSEFSDATNDHGSGENTSEIPGGAWVRGRMNSGGGSQGYMTVIVTGPTIA